MIAKDERIILLIDAIINLLLGALLIFFCDSIIRLFGLPVTDQIFYPSILGAILFGIGIALLIEVLRKKSSFFGLGLGGAVTINMCGGIVLAYWLIFKNLNIPQGGRIFLWILVVILVGISSVEYCLYYFRSKKKI